MEPKTCVLRKELFQSPVPVKFLSVLKLAGSAAQIFTITITVDLALSGLRSLWFWDTKCLGEFPL
jgi:hypothetical protein